MVSIKSIEIVQEEDGEDVYKSSEEISAVEARECVGYRLEGDECPGQSQPIGFPPSHFLDELVDILVDDLVDHFFLKVVDLGVLLLEFPASVCLHFDEVK